MNTTKTRPSKKKVCDGGKPPYFLVFTSAASGKIKLQFVPFDDWDEWSKENSFLYNILFSEGNPRFNRKKDTSIIPTSSLPLSLEFFDGELPITIKDLNQEQRGLIQGLLDDLKTSMITLLALSANAGFEIGKKQGPKK